MGVEIHGEPGGILTIKLFGKLSQAEMIDLRRRAIGLLARQGKAAVLIMATEFRGWDKLCDWGDFDQQVAVDPHIVRMAIVGDPQWEELARIFTAKGMRKFPIEFFNAADQTVAESWVRH